MFADFGAICAASLRATRTHPPKEWANKWTSNLALGITALLFLALGINQVWSSVTEVLG